MADIIRIEERLSRSDRKMAMGAPAGQKAVILLFTGIRYERRDGLAEPRLPALPRPQGSLGQDTLGR